MAKEIDWGVRKTVNYTFLVYKGDMLLIEQITEILGCSRSEAIRSALRAYAHSLSLLAK